MSKESKSLKIEGMRATILAAGLAAAMGGAGAAHAADAGTEVVVSSLAIGTDGFGPTGLTQLPNGTFYGWSFNGPTNTNQESALFSVTPTGSFTSLVDLCASVSSCPLGDYASGLILGADGNFYAATGNGGGLSFDGAFLKITPGGAISTIYDFTSVAPYPSVQVSVLGSNLLLGADGNFYGTAQLGDFNTHANPSGSIYQITPAGAFSLIYAFSAATSGVNADGAKPQAALIQASDGNFYGTAYTDGPNSTGTVFEVTPAGVFTVLHAFSAAPSTADGAAPAGGLVIGTDGNFYGTTYSGGVNGVGTIFKITSTPDHTFTKLHDFGTQTLGSVTFNANSASVSGGQSYTLSWNFVDDSQDSGNPTRALVLGSDGNFYGVTHLNGANPGVAFQMTPAGAYTILHTFGGAGTDLNGNAVSDGSQPLSLIAGADGDFYGTTESGGANNDGTIFRLAVGAAPPSTPCTASSAWSGILAAAGSQSISQASPGNYTYSISCLESGTAIHATANFTLHVTASSAAPTATLVANPTAIILGQSSTLTWSSSNATACTAANAWSGAVGTSGTTTVTPTAIGNASYQLTCSGAAGTTPIVVVAAVTVTAPPAPTASLTASPSAITLGQSSTLTWSSTHATSCTAGGGWSGARGTSGTATVTPTAIGNASYQLTCSGAAGTTPIVVNASVTVTAATTPSPGGSGGGGSLGIGTLVSLIGLVLLRSRRQERKGRNVKRIHLSLRAPHQGLPPVNVSQPSV